MNCFRGFLIAGWCCLPVAGIAAADKARSVIIFDGIATEVTTAAGPSGDLWLTTADLTRATKLELKPEGVCIATLCIPLPEARKKEFIRSQGKEAQFNLSEFARLLKQPVAHDSRHGIWFFGPRPDSQNGYLKTLIAPDFTLPDRNGKMHSLSDYRGKKVLLITWASW
jgi:hypothetical protein